MVLTMIFICKLKTFWPSVLRSQILIFDWILFTSYGKDFNEKDKIILCMNEVKAITEICASIRKTSLKLKTCANQFIYKLSCALYDLSIKKPDNCLDKIQEMLSNIGDNAQYLSRGFLLRLLNRVCHLYSLTSGCVISDIEKYWEDCVSKIGYIQKLESNMKEFYTFKSAFEYFEENSLALELMNWAK